MIEQKELSYFETTLAHLRKVKLTLTDEIGDKDRSYKDLQKPLLKKVAPQLVYVYTSSQLNDCFAVTFQSSPPY